MNRIYITLFIIKVPTKKPNNFRIKLSPKSNFINRFPWQHSIRRVGIGNHFGSATILRGELSSDQFFVMKKGIYLLLPLFFCQKGICLRHRANGLENKLLFDEVLLNLIDVAGLFVISCWVN